MKRIRLSPIAAVAALALARAASAQPLTEDFVVVPTPGWQSINNATPPGTTTVFQGSSTVFPSHAGAANAYVGMNFNGATLANTCSTWYISPLRIGILNFDFWSFFTRTVQGSTFPDRLEFRLSTNGSCSPGTSPTAVGDFTTLLLTINPTLRSVATRRRTPTSRAICPGSRAPSTAASRSATS